MPAYQDVEDESLAFLGRHCTDKDLPQGYWKPPHDPKYTAATRLEDIGLGVSRMLQLRVGINSRMASVFGSAWQPAGPFTVSDLTSIGEFIKRMCKLTNTPIPAGFPR